MAIYCSRTSMTNLKYLRRLFYWNPLYQSCLQNSVGGTCGSGSEILKNIRCYSKKINDVDCDEDSKPVKFSTSDAAQWKAEYSRMGAKDDGSPPSQPVVVSLSLAAFLLYFLVLRESNDIDIKLAGGSLTDMVANLEEIQLKLVVEDDIKNNRPSDPKVLKRLKELEDLKMMI
ncbi:uncharacterized protein LOC142330131 [Lycorma delicatula]|uniref:uncharacterized protein LOC142330131 n=1 Tax=Lycorma delicatula TaxID=130591 RepID=UPI003F51A08F